MILAAVGLGLTFVGATPELHWLNTAVEQFTTFVPLATFFIPISAFMIVKWMLTRI